MAESEEVQETSGRSPRFTLWVAFLVFSTITLGSSVESKNHPSEDVELDDRALANQKWAVACSAITFSLTFIVVCMHLSAVASLFIVGTKIEGLLCIILMAFWAATVAIVSDARHGLAVKPTGEVDNGNLYYFSWAGFMCSVVLTVSYLRSAFHVDIAGEIKTRSARLTTWAALLASSVVVLGSSANIFDSDCSVSADNTFCRRTIFSLALGASSTVFALLVVGMKIATAKAPFMLEAVLSILLLILYAFGVAYTTSKQGPGAPLGNLYYFTWGCFMSSFMLAASCSEDYQNAKAMTAESQEGGNMAEGPGGEEIHVESLDDTI